MVKRKLPDPDQVRCLIRRVMAAGSAGRVLHRLDGVLLVAQGRSCTEVARWFGVSPRTVGRWLRGARDAGQADWPVRQRRRGRRARLEGDGLERIRQQLLQAPAALGYPEQRWTGKRLSLHLSRTAGITLSVRSCQRLMARCAARRAEPASSRYKGDTASGALRRHRARKSRFARPDAGDL